MKDMKADDWKTVFWVLAVLGLGARVTKSLLAPRQGCVSRSGTSHLGLRLEVEGCYEEGKLRYRWLAMTPTGVLRGESYESEAEASLRGRAAIEAFVRDKMKGDSDSFEKEPTPP